MTNLKRYISILIVLMVLRLISVMRYHKKLLPISLHYSLNKVVI